MNEKTLLKIALICSLLGIIALFIISNALEVNERVISEIDETDLGYNIKVKGVVTNIRNMGSVLIINMVQLEKIDVVVFNDELVLNKGDYVEIVGKLEEYEGKLELIADRIDLK